MPGPLARTVSDFSSPTYWSDRFLTERSFEWLLPSAQIVPLVLDYVKIEVHEAGRGGTYRGLHLGCGTSDLGAVIERALKEAATQGGNQLEVEVVDSDYVADNINRGDEEQVNGPMGIDAQAGGVGQQRRILPLDCLDIDDLAAKSTHPLRKADTKLAEEGDEAGRPGGYGWDFVLDKSSADAISCGPLIGGLEPLEILLRNMARVTKEGTRWISISYSANRYDCLFSPPHIDATTESESGEMVVEEKGNGKEGFGWRVLERRFLASTSLPEGRRWKDEQGVERVVYEPETGVWGWVLERT